MAKRTAKRRAPSAIEEEEDEMFPKLRRSGINLRALGAKLMARKTRLA
jgi:hypothetical protein